jgi:hypothetical protein
MKRKYVWHDGQFVDVTDWKRPAPKFPAIIRDTMDAAWHPATGEMMDSKSRFREVTKAHGLVEVGNDCQNRQNPAADLAKDRKQDIAEAWQMVEQGYQAPPIESVSDWDGPTKLYGDT